MQLRIAYTEYDLREAALRQFKGRWNPITRLWDISDKYLRVICTLNPTLAGRVVAPKPLPLRQFKPFEHADAPYLYPFQYEGIKWFERRGSGLWVLDMGLGKTVMAVAFAAHLLRHGVVDRVIVYCPASVRHQWEAEFREKEKIEALVVKATGRERRQRLYRSDAKVFIINYELLLQDADHMKPLMPNSFVILDEVTRIKSHRSRTYKTLSQLLSAPVAAVVGLTGSPVENSPMDLVNILTIVSPGVISRTEFLTNHCVFDMVYLGRKVGHRRLVVDYKDLHKFRQRVSPFIFVKTKMEVAPFLPPLTESCIKVEPDRVQRRMEAAIMRIARQIARLEGLSHGFIMLSALRLVWDDVRLIRLSEGKIAKRAYARLLADGIGVSLDYVSPKLKEVASLVAEVGAHQRVVIFTQFERMLQFIGDALKDCGRPLFFCRGGQAEENMKQQQAFAESDGGILVTTDVLSYGINLDCADVLIHYDIPWNPAKLEQRSQRIHRLTSQNPKHIVYLVCGNEDKVLQVVKQKIGWHSMVTPHERWNILLSIFTTLMPHVMPQYYKRGDGDLNAIDET